mgnify:CR=1 FL=1
MDFSSVNTTLRAFCRNTGDTDAKSIAQVRTCLQSTELNQRHWLQINRLISTLGFSRMSIRNLRDYSNIRQTNAPVLNYLKFLMYRYTSPMVGANLCQAGLKALTNPKHRIILQAHLLELALHKLQSPELSTRQTGLNLLETLALGEQNDRTILAEARYYLGSLLYTTQNSIHPTVAPDRARALAYLKQASEVNHPQARLAYTALTKDPDNIKEAFTTNTEAPTKARLTSLSRRIAKGRIDTHLSDSPIVALKKLLQEKTLTLETWKKLEAYALKRLSTKNRPGAHLLLSLLHLYGTHNIARSLIEIGIPKSPRNLNPLVEALHLELGLLFLEDTQSTLRQTGFIMLKTLADNAECHNLNIFFTVAEIFHYGYLGATEVNTEEAIKYYTKAEQHSSKLAYLRLAQLQKETGRLSEALNHYRLASAGGYTAEALKELLLLIEDLKTKKAYEDISFIFTELFKIKKTLVKKNQFDSHKDLFESVYTKVAEFTQLLLKANALHAASELYKIVLAEETDFSKIEPEILAFGAALEAVDDFQNAKTTYTLLIQRAQELKAPCQATFDALALLAPHFKEDLEQQIDIYSTLTRAGDLESFVALANMLNHPKIQSYVDSRPELHRQIKSMRIQTPTADSIKDAALLDLESEFATLQIIVTKIYASLSDFLDQTKYSLKKKPLTSKLSKQQIQTIETALKVPKKKKPPLFRMRSFSASSGLPSDWEDSPTITRHNRSAGQSTTRRKRHQAIKAFIGGKSRRKTVDLGGKSPTRDAL